MRAQLQARFRRWWYLLTQGMCRGECAVTISDEKGVKIIGSGAPSYFGRHVYKNYRIYWERK